MNPIPTTKNKGPIDTVIDINTAALKRVRLGSSPFALTALVAYNAFSILPPISTVKPQPRLDQPPLTGLKPLEQQELPGAKCLSKENIIKEIFSFLFISEINNIGMYYKIPRFQDLIPQDHAFYKTFEYKPTLSPLEKSIQASMLTSAAQSTALTVISADKAIPPFIRKELQALTTISMDAVIAYMNMAGLSIDTIFQLLGENLKSLELDISDSKLESLFSDYRNEDARLKLKDDAAAHHAYKTKIASFIEQSIVSAGKYCHNIESLALPVSSQTHEVEYRNKYMSAFCANASAWKKLKGLKFSSIDSQAIFVELKKLPTLNKLSLHVQNPKFMQSEFSQMLDSLPNLTNLQLQGSFASKELSEGFISISKKCLKLQSFAFSPDKNITMPKSILEVIRNCTQLKSFKLGVDIDAEIINAVCVHLPMIENLALDLTSDALVLKLFNRCKNLKSFECPSPLNAHLVGPFIDTVLMFERPGILHLKIDVAPSSADLVGFTINDGQEESYKSPIRFSKIRDLLDYFVKNKSKSIRLSFSRIWNPEDQKEINSLINDYKKHSNVLFHGFPTVASK